MRMTRRTATVGGLGLLGTAASGAARADFGSWLGGLGEGLLISGHSPADPAAEDTWGPLPLDFFA